MNKESFNQLISKIDVEISKCEKLKISPSQFDDMKVSEARSIVDKAKAMQASMDKVAQAELYHILNMAGLTVTQQSKFLSRFHKWFSYRSDIKRLAGHPAIAALPQNDGVSKYKCEILGVKVSG